MRSSIRLLALAALAFFLLHLFTNNHYGFHRDELQTLDDARHLDWGFVQYPPITPLFGRVELLLFGTSLVGFRVLSTIAVSVVMLLTGLIAKELGGDRHIQLLAAIAVGISPVSMIQGAVFQYVAFDYLWGVAVTYCLIRLLQSGDPRWWLLVGTFIGIGMETRYTMGFLALGVAGAVLVSEPRFLRSRWLWLGVAISIVIFLPNLVWQAQHHFISRDFLTYLHARDLRQGRYDAFYREQLWVCIAAVTAPLALMGLWFYFFRPEARRFRLLGWTFAITFFLFAVAGARSYYTAPLYPMLLAGGSVLLGIWLRGLPPLWSRSIYALQWVSIAAGLIIGILLFLPVAPIGSRVWQITSKLYDQFREEIGWPDLAHAVAGVYNALPAEQRAQTGILTGNYGEAGALNLYGPALGLPHAMSLTNSFWYRGYDPRLPQTVILTGFDLAEANDLFEDCSVAGKNTNSSGVENEESRDHPQILLCHNLRTSWPDYWAHHRRFG
jgi:4-amino-4-deoxy-L-arabinose transferase-like glycosyltransferase